MLHIDGDMIAYRIACAVGDEGEEWQVKANCNSFIATEILMYFPELTPYHVYLSGDTNFRDDIAVTAPYKGNRDSKEKPKYLPLMRQHLQDTWGAVIYEGIEADDAIATAVTEAQKRGETNEVIVSLDKDFDQLPCDRFNFVSKATTSPDAWEALQNLYKQILTGDTVDNIIGAEGCGDVTASMLIDNCRSELDMALIVIDQMGLERAGENGELVYLQRGGDDDYFWFPQEIAENAYNFCTPDGLRSFVEACINIKKDMGI